MAAGMNAIRRALLTRVGTIQDVTTYPFVPDSINAPAMFVQPGQPFVDYQKAFRGGGTEWKFFITILVNRIDEESAQDDLDDYLDPDGVLVDILQSRDVDDALFQLVDYVEVMSAQRYGAYRIGNTTYLGAEMVIVVRS